MRTTFLMMVFLCILTSIGPLSAREWTYDNGKSRVEGEFVAVRKDKVVLEKPDGTFLSISLEKLSAADQAYVRSQTTGKSTKPTEPTEKGADDAPGLVKSFHGLTRTRSLAFSPQGGLLAVGDINLPLSLFDLKTSRRLGQLEESKGLGEVTSCTFAPDGAKLLAGGTKGDIHVYAVSKEGRLKYLDRFVGHSEEIHCIAVSRDGRFAVSGGADKRLRYWQIEGAKEVRAFEGFAHGVKACFISDDGRSAMGYDGSTVLIINLAKREVTRTIEPTDSEDVPSTPGASGAPFAAFSPDGSLLAAASPNNVRFWEFPSGKELPTKLVDRDVQHGGAFTPDGTRLVTLGSGKLNVWDVRKGRKITRFDILGAGAVVGQISPIVISPDNKHVAVAVASAAVFFEPGQDQVKLFRLPSADK
jgi:WD40 repeat protein